MKRVLLVSLGLIAMASYAGCLPDEGTTTGSGGSPGTGGSPQGAGGNPQGAGGNPQGAGGTTGDGGSGVGGDGTGGTAGSTATGGTGGQGATGGDPQGAGGNPTAGSGGGGGTPRGGAGGATGGSGGAGGTPRGGAGGATGGSGGAGGTPRGGSTGTGGGGTTGTGGASAIPTVPELFPSGTDGSLDGRLLTMPCNETTTGTDCASAGADYRGAHIACANGSLNVMHTYPVGGVAGRQYKVTMHFYGISEPKNYGSGATREATGTARPNNSQTNGGASLTPTPWAYATAVPHTYNVSDYNTNEIHVYEGNTERAAYYLNADTMEGHWSYVINYAKQITVYGGGTVRVRNYDRNCRQIKNCGSVDSYPCASKANARIITIPATVMPAVPAGALTQPNLVSSRSADNSGQWLLIDVESVDSQM